MIDRPYSSFQNKMARNFYNQWLKHIEFSYRFRMYQDLRNKSGIKTSFFRPKRIWVPQQIPVTSFDWDQVGINLNRLIRSNLNIIFFFFKYPYSKPADLLHDPITQQKIDTDFISIGETLGG